MKIAYDYQAFTNQSYGGISRYYKDLIEELLKQGQEVNIFAGIHRNFYISLLPDEVIHGIKLNGYPPKSTWAFRLFNHLICQLQTQRWKPDIIHETYYSTLPVSKKNVARITSVHDMIHELYPQKIYSQKHVTDHKKKTLSRVDHIISVSENTKRDLITLFGIDESKISVVHHGINSSLFQNIGSNCDFPNKPYLLYVGSRTTYKNFSGFIKAVASSSLLKKNFNLVVISSKFSNSEKNFISSLGFKFDQVKQISNITDLQLAQFYRHASAFIYPSLYEGFGLPPLEAMSAGCPVVCSNVSSIPEVVNNAGVYFNPHDIEEIRNAIERVVFSEDLKNKLVKLGYENIKNFSTSKCASKTLEVYSRLVGKV